jgi:hypothetical protein
MRKTVEAHHKFTSAGWMFAEIAEAPPVPRPDTLNALLEPLVKEQEVKETLVLMRTYAMGMCDVAAALELLADSVRDLYVKLEQLDRKA